MTDDLFTVLFDAGERFASEMESRGIVDYPDHWATTAADIDSASGAADQSGFAKIPVDRSTREASAKKDLQLARLQLVMQGMWEVMRDRHGVTEQELEAKILEIDLRDGTKDGRIAREVAICSACNRKTGIRHHRKCFYCGEPIKAQHIVES